MPNNQSISEWFELSYANYLTIPRSILESMPEDWQKQFTALLNELDETFNWRPVDGCYWVKLKNSKGHILKDPLDNYRRPDIEYIASLKTGGGLDKMKQIIWRQGKYGTEYGGILQEKFFMILFEVQWAIVAKGEEPYYTLVSRLPGIFSETQVQYKSIAVAQEAASEILVKFSKIVLE